MYCSIARSFSSNKHRRKDRSDSLARFKSQLQHVLQLTQTKRLFGENLLIKSMSSVSFQCSIPTLQEKSNLQGNVCVRKLRLALPIER